MLIFFEEIVYSYVIIEGYHLMPSYAAHGHQAIAALATVLQPHKPMVRAYSHANLASDSPPEKSSPWSEQVQIYLQSLSRSFFNSGAYFNPNISNLNLSKKTKKLYLSSMWW